MGKRYYYGGQAVLEGVMMRGRRQMAVAVRRPDGRIALYSEPLDSWVHRSPVRNWPFVRGVFVLWDALLLGMRAMTLSANVAYIGEEEALRAKAPAAPSPNGRAATPSEAAPAVSGISGPALWGTVAVSLLLGIGLFFVLPLLITGFLDRWIASSLVSNLVEGGLRLGILLGYLGAIGRVPDIRRVFGYHGAEHKTINAYERGAPLEVAAVQRQSTLHTRCGTGFLLVVVLFSVVVFAFLGRPPLPLRILSRIGLLPLIAAVAYEFIRFGAAHWGNRLVRLLLAPSLALQRVTTREPEDGMVETALVAFKRVLVADGLLAHAAAGLDDTVPIDSSGAALPAPAPAAEPEPVPLATL